MRIERICLADYRGVTRHEVELTGGVTVIEGENEAGKSSLAEAIDLLLNYRDDSQDKRVKSVRPVHTGAAPRVEIEFTAGPYRFTYSKRWSHRVSEADTRLEITAPVPDVIRGREAHERALEILREHADLDLWKALRVLQNETLDQPELGEKSALMRALDAAAGIRPDGERDAGDQRNSALIDAAHDEFLRYFTREKGQPTGEYHKAIKAVGEAQDDVRARKATLDRVQQDIEAHRQAERSLVRLREDERRAGPALETLEQRARELDEAAAKVARLEDAAKLAWLEAATATTALRAREDLREEEQTAATEAVALSRQAERAEATLADRQALADEAQQEAARARDAAGEAEATAQRADDDYDHLRELDEQGRLGERVTRAQKADAEVKQLIAELATIRIDDATVRLLEKEQQKVIKAQASLEAASSLVEIAALDDERSLMLDVDGRPTLIEAGATFSRKLGEDTTLVVDDSIRIRVAPGNAERDQRAKLGKAQDEYGKICATAGVTGIEDAREQLSRRTAATAKLEAARATINAALDGESADAASERLAALRARTEQYAAARASSSVIAPPLPAHLAEAQGVLDTAHDALKRARSEAEQVEAVAATHSQAAIRADTDARVLRQRALDAGTRAQRCADKLAAERVNLSDEQLAATRDHAARAADEAQQMWDAAASAFDADAQAVVVAQLENERRTMQRRETEIHEYERELAQLGAKLANDRDAEERLNDALSRLDEAQSEQEKLRKRAAAAKRLYETLAAKRDEAKRAYVEPFRRKLEQFAKIVFGSDGLSLLVDDDLAVTHRILDGAKVPYAQLSGGAREQIALCARLACASLVDPEDGVPVVIDDALGFTDPDRLHRIGAVFSAAENRSQIIVLTCMPDRYKAIGVANVIRLRRSLPANPITRAPAAPDAAHDEANPSVPGDTVAATGSAAEPTEAAVLSTLRNAAEPLGKAELIERSGIDPDRWTAVISSLLDRGLIERQGERRGAKYTMT